MNIKKKKKKKNNQNTNPILLVNILEKQLWVKTVYFIESARIPVIKVITF